MRRGLQQYLDEGLDGLAKNRECQASEQFMATVIAMLDQSAPNFHFPRSKQTIRRCSLAAQCRWKMFWLKFRVASFSTYPATLRQLSRIGCSAN